MGRHETIHLQETVRASAAEARVIDVEFSEVREARRPLWSRTKSVLQKLVWAAAIGFLIPPAWVLIQIVGETVRAF